MVPAMPSAKKVTIAEPQRDLEAGRGAGASAPPPGPNIVLLAGLGAAFVVALIGGSCLADKYDEISNLEVAEAGFWFVVSAHPAASVADSGHAHSCGVFSSGSLWL